MIIYAETNFLLEVALQQEQWQGCEQVLQLTEQHQVQLVVPAFCLTEAQQTLRNKGQRRRELGVNLKQELRELRRIASYADTVGETLRVVDLLSSHIEQSSERLAALYARLQVLVAFVPLDEEIAATAIDYRERLKLAMPDAIVLASVVGHAKQISAVRKVFLNRNSRDFEGEFIRAELQQVDCELLPSFNGVPQRMGLV